MTPRVRNILQSHWESAGKPVEGWVLPAATRSRHMEPSTIKKQHSKAIQASKVRTFVRVQPATHIPNAPWGVGLRHVELFHSQLNFVETVVNLQDFAAKILALNRAA